MGANPTRLPESFNTSSGTRIIDDIREMRDFFGWSTPVDELLARRQRIFDDICRTAELAPMPGVARVTRELHGRGVILAITSSAVRASIELILDRLGMRQFFALIVDGSDVEVGKPDPAAFLMTAEKLGVAPSECVVFEDSHVGVLAAKRAGMFCVAVRNRRARTPQDLSAADLVLQGFLEIDVGVILAAVGSGHLAD